MVSFNDNVPAELWYTSPAHQVLFDRSILNILYRSKLQHLSTRKSWKERPGVTEPCMTAMSLATAGQQLSPAAGHSKAVARVLARGISPGPPAPAPYCSNPVALATENVRTKSKWPRIRVATRKQAAKEPRARMRRSLAQARRTG